MCEERFLKIDYVLITTFDPSMGSDVFLNAVCSSVGETKYISI